MKAFLRAAKALLAAALLVDYWLWLIRYGAAVWAWVRSGFDPDMCPEFAFEDEEPGL